MSGSVHEMDNKEQRTVIKFLTWEGAAAKAIHERLVEQLGGSAVSYETVTGSAAGSWHPVCCFFTTMLRSTSAWLQQLPFVRLASRN